MKILFSSASGSDKGVGIHYRKVMSRLGHDVRWLSAPNSGRNLSQGDVPEAGLPVGTSLENILWFMGTDTPDLFLYLEPRGIIPEGIERANFPTACLICDVHQYLEPRQMLSLFFDHVFLYQRNYLSKFERHPEGHIHWLPYACDLDLFYPRPIECDLDVAFIGQLNSPRRQQIVARLLKHYRLNEQRYYFQDEIPEAYSRAKIVINLPAQDDLNFRFFEALSCGAMLLTERIANGQEELFCENVHYAAFADDDELFSKIDYYLEHESEREAIAQAGLAEVRQRHRLEMRINELVQVISQKPDFAAPVRSMTPEQLDWQYAKLYEYWRLVDPGLQTVKKARTSGRPWLHLTAPVVWSVLRGIFR